MTLAFETRAGAYDENLFMLIDLISKTPERAIVLAPEVCLTGFDYDRMASAADFAVTADRALREAVEMRYITLTMIIQRDGAMFNAARVYHNGSLIHEQTKAKLFLLGEEHHWFASGRMNEIALFKTDGIRMGILICFELRFTALWEQLKGAELIMVPAQWGKRRANHFAILGQGLAVANQCYVLQSDGRGAETTGICAVTTPSGEMVRNHGDASMIAHLFSMSEVKKMRRYLNTGVV